jgi:hypothetical protein
VGISRWRFGSDDGVAVMVGASRRMRQYGTSQYCSHNMVQYCNIVPYGNIAILYGTQLTLSIDTYNIVGLRRISIFSEIRSPCGALQPFFQNAPFRPPKKCHRGAAPIGLSKKKDLIEQFLCLICDTKSMMINTELECYRYVKKYSYCEYFIFCYLPCLMIKYSYYEYFIITTKML